MAFITLGKTKTQKFFNGVALILLIGYAISKIFSAFDTNITEVATKAVKNTVGATYFEIEITKNGLDDYSKDTIIQLLSSYYESDQGKDIAAKISSQGISSDYMSVVIYEDKIDFQEEIGWVIRFEVSTENLKFDKSQSIASEIGRDFLSFVKAVKQG